MNARRRDRRDDRKAGLAEALPGVVPRSNVGPRWFGPAYAAMMRRDPHARGSVDRQLLRTMVGLDDRTVGDLYDRRRLRRASYRKGSRPVLEAIARGIAPANMKDEARVRAIVRFTSLLPPDSTDDLDRTIFGGTEEEIVARGSDWCTDVARVACALFQVVGLPSRLVFLADTRKAYSGHALVEAYRRGRWGAVDPLSDVVYLTGRGLPATTWDLMTHPGLVDRHYRGRTPISSRRGEFRTAAVANYVLGRRSDFDYRRRKISPYYRSILRMSNRGWPGGLRWLHHEGRTDP